MSLNGIGEATAQKIIADREKNGPFSSVDDLTRVSGIGEKKLAALRESICV
jgi:competence protein ComEA